ncbi:MAG: glycoside hydrolase family 15 protein [Candidatus Roizmanbacteria bacterium]
MARHIVLGNQKLLVNIDQWLQVRDLYFPYVGQYNHLVGHAQRMAIVENDEISWLNEESWHRHQTYEQDTMISDVTAVHEEKKISIQLKETVLPDSNVFLRQITIKNKADTQRKIRFAYHHDIHMYGDGIGDTGYYDPKHRALIFYKQSTYFLIGYSTDDGRQYVFDYDIGPHTEPSMNLAKRPIHQGKVSAVMAIDLEIAPHSTQTFCYYLIADENLHEVYKANTNFLSRPTSDHFSTVKAYDKSYLEKIKPEISALPEKIQSLFKRSLLVIKTQINKNGAIIASTDTDIMQFNRDTYCYMWPRDGALVAISLIRAGYADLAKPFFEFCRDVLYEDGCLLHKYNPDKTLGSSWHPWVHKGVQSLPIQEDETALVLHALWIYYEETKDIEFIKSMFFDLIKPMGDFLSAYKYQPFDIPKESYDLWEERRAILTFTTATVVAGLIAGKRFAGLVADANFEQECEKEIQKYKEAMIKLFYNAEKGYFRRGVSLENGAVEYDEALDASVYAIFEFGVFAPDDPMVVSTMQKVKEWLSVKTPVGGIARYWKDNYFSKSDDCDRIPGNPWFITTLWYAKWLVEKAKSQDDLVEAMNILNWVSDHALSSGILAEQLHPDKGEPLSVSPLTWSHAEFIDTVNRYTVKIKQLGIQDSVEFVATDVSTTPIVEAITDSSIGGIPLDHELEPPDDFPMLPSSHHAFFAYLDEVKRTGIKLI